MRHDAEQLQKECEQHLNTKVIDIWEYDFIMHIEMYSKEQLQTMSDEYYLLMKLIAEKYR